MAITELARAGLAGKSRPRKRVADGNGATVMHLAGKRRLCRDLAARRASVGGLAGGNGLAGLGQRPALRHQARPGCQLGRAPCADVGSGAASTTSSGSPIMAQAAHVPSFPLREPAEQLASPQLAHRKFWRRIEIGGRTVKAPGPPFGLQITVRLAASRADRGAGPMPLSGVRVLDFSWVIAGPTATRYLAAMGAEVIKIEAPGRGDPGRASELHTVLGQAKRGIVLDLKKPEAVAIARGARRQIATCWSKISRPGVMDRLGLGADALQALNPDLIYVSASGLGRTGPEAHAVAYGTLLQCYAGFAGLNRHPDIRAARRLRLARPDVRADARFHRRRRAVAPAAGTAVWRGSISR